MKRKFLKLFIPVLVLAMLIQVPFALSASASTLSQATSINFTLSKAADTAPGNCEIKMTANTNSNERITTIGATLVINTDYYDLVNDEGTVVTDNYKVDSIQIGEGFPLEASAIENGLSFEEADACSLVSFNSTTKEMYVFVAGLSAAGLKLGENAEIFKFYINAKDGTVPSSENIRVMRTDEYKDTSACPDAAIFPGEISSKNVVLVPTAQDLVENVTLTLPEIPQNGSISDIINSDLDVSNVSIKLIDSADQETTVSIDSSTVDVEDVPAGTYTVEVSAPGSLGFKFLNVNVLAGEKTTLPEITLIFGDADSDGVISPLDVAEIIKNIGGDYQIKCDADGDSVISPLDIGKVLQYDHFGKEAGKQVVDLGA